MDMRNLLLEEPVKFFLEWLFSVVVLLQFYQTVDGNDITTLKNNQITISFRVNGNAISLNGKDTW